ncbi:CAP domain-containing protein [Baekduia soli]|uniref:CAP domain-containing protein n=1 Tax=Baekduia soli TaxID=496014 RepID=A0A5B8UB67_9ACTN|nr:CAP domain-containing protein [Baekduia soli]QEC49892.1 CAP domain-containing protein [Baekduia soli]
MSRIRLVLPAIFATAALSAPAAAAPTGPAATPFCRGANAMPTASDSALMRSATLCLLNRQRARFGLPRLHAQRSLTHAARTYAVAMVRQSFFAHVSPNGSTMAQRIKRTRYLHGVRGWVIGENLAWGTGSAATPAEIVDAWMHSPPHRRNILDPSFREIGIGVAQGAPSRVFAAGRAGTYATEFGRRGLQHAPRRR